MLAAPVSVQLTYWLIHVALEQAGNLVSASNIAAQHPPPSVGLCCPCACLPCSRSPVVCVLSPIVRLICICCKARCTFICSPVISSRRRDKKLRSSGDFRCYHSLCNPLLFPSSHIADLRRLPVVLLG
ncbi:uncharacterized protein LY79DRAFT_250664 [Colletotrichum navitas]|uniref:Uncharacterized protein n=1 Tax=Colletotrichum navitas TaxID=681940 RepID=A0AAD8VA27_9PEZI|nr:uncharacterized protein LY79DRAFT_250664 [Colletotrichum navitas]KAK1598639.1 hypothetical protein LY79DRAFT_250664 [Colletotrichum navitas]